MINKASLVNDLENLGIRKGDTLFIRASLGKIGRIKRNDKHIIIDSLLEVIGDDGTLVTLGFSKIFPFWRIDKSFVFNKNSPSNTGALSKIFMSHDNCKRSAHPCCSFLSIGKYSDFILEGHNENSTSYLPVGKLIELDAKCLLIGCVADSPGFTTVHYSQEKLGLTKKSILSSFFRVFYEDKDGRLNLFVRRDVGGCSSGFGKFYSDYLKAGILRVGDIGDAYSILANAKELFSIEIDIISRNNSYPLCDNKCCFVCRCSWYYNIKDIPCFLVHKILGYFFPRKS